MKDVSLLDYFQWKMRCEYLSDLHRLSGEQRVRLAWEIEKIKAERASLREWNDALEYLLVQPPQPEAEAARDALIAGLKAQDKQGEGDHGKLQL